MILTIACMVFGIASLGASFMHVVVDLDQPGTQGVGGGCGKLIGVTGEASDGCAPVRQAEATSALASGMAGATWMIAAVATATVFRGGKKMSPAPVVQQPQAMAPPPQYPQR